MTYARKTLSEIKLIHGDYGNFIKGQKLQKDKEKKYKTPPYQDLAASTEVEGETLNEKCWPGYEKKGMKTMFGKRYPNCVKKKKTRKEEYSDWRSELQEKKGPTLPGQGPGEKPIDLNKAAREKLNKAKSNTFQKNTIKEPQLPKTKSNVKSMNMISIKPGDTIASLTKKYGDRAKGMINRLYGGIDTSREDKLSQKLVNQAKKSKNSASYRAMRDVAKGTAPRRGLAKLAARAGKALAKTPKGALAAGALFGGVAAARAIGRKFNEIRKKRKDAAIDRQVDKYVADRKIPGGPKKVNYKPTNQYTVTRDSKGKVTGTGKLIRVVPGTEFKEATMTPAQKRKDTMLKKKYEKSDDMMDSFKDQYGKKKGKEVFYAFIRKKSMEEENIQEILDKKDVPHIKKLIKKLKDGSELHAKQSKDLEVALKTENTAIESELLIQDWNKDDIKFTEIETVDIIKAKPLKESMSNWRDELDEDWQKVNRQDKTDGLSKKAVKAYRRENPGSKLQTAVTKDPKKLKKGSKSAKRRLSFCRRMKGMKKKLTSAKTRRDPDSRINKALRRWNC